MKNQIVKHHLIRWAYFDKNFSYLGDTEAIKMKILYAALKELTPKERAFLAEKYRVAVKPTVKDSELADKHGISLREYREKRIRLETRLKPSILKYSDQHKEELSKAVSVEYMK